ncbi:MAG: molecular chaperone HtpG [Puniceicoccaceae bacterium]|nr:MAG: molecular chaperone HtpG [Puniceicoccaceae bacterium]
MSQTQAERFEFQAEIRQLLDIVIHSLYTEKEIFVRELVSNAADALEKLRHLQLTEKTVFDDHLALEINLTTDDTKGTFTIQDFGIGMTREELVENLGTIAHSGSRHFLQALKEGGQAGASLIGQFGVGFYSAFMVAKSVTVYTRSWKPDAQGWLWRSDGSGSYEIEPAEGQRRGCKIVVELTEEAKEFAKAERIRSILRHYSAFVPVPINLNGERINTVQAIWLRSRNEIKDEDYNEFYKFQANAFDNPRYRLHFSADAPLAIHALLFVPEDNPERLGLARIDPGVSLYCKKILIEQHPEDLLPEWLRFLRGVVDCEDLPLNISRETMQDRALLDKLGRVISNRFLKFLDEEASKRPEDYEAFYAAFSNFLKEGIVTSFTHREPLAKLLRFASTTVEAGKTTGLADYVSRMPEDQKEIYFLSGPSRDALESGPYLEAFRSRGIEVLLLTDSSDPFVMDALREYDGKPLVAADRAGLKVDAVGDPNRGEPLPEERAKALCDWLQALLGERVKAIRPSNRLVDSPAIALNPEGAMSAQVRRMLKAARQVVPDAVAVEFELNLRHGLIHRLDALRESREDLARLVGEQLFDNALMAAGLLEDPRPMINRLNRLLEETAARATDN